MCHAAFNDMTPEQVNVRCDTIRRLLNSKRHTNEFNLVWNILDPLSPELLAQVLVAHGIAPETPAEALAAT